MSVIMPKVIGYKIMTPDLKAVISEHGPDELELCRKLILGPDRAVLRSEDRKPTPVLQYVFEKIEDDEPVH
jgi:hypothetical protein